MEQKFIEIKKFEKNVFFSTLLESDYIFKTIVREKDFYEHELLDWLLVVSIQKGSFIDVGANIGNHTLFFSKIMERKCYSFEPNSTAYNILEENIKINKLETKVNSFKVALGSTIGKASIVNMSDNNLGATTLAYQHDGDIDVKTLDLLIPKNEPIALLKIDVEGFEFDVLEGAKKTIQKNTPMLLIECMNKIIINKTIEYLKELDYEPITLFGATPMLVFVHKSKVVSNFGQNVPNFYSELKSYISEQEKIRNINKRYRELSESKDTIKIDLEEARKKYRFSTEQIADYKLKMADLQNYLKEMDAQSQKFKQEKEYLQTESEKLQNELKEEKSSHKEDQKRLEQYREDILNKEKELIRLENEHQKSVEQLNQTNEKYKSSVDEIEALKNSLDRFKQEKEYLQTESERLQNELKEEKSSHKEDQKRLEQCREDILNKEKELIRLENEHQKSVEQLNQTNEKYRVSTTKVNDLKSSIENLQKEKDEINHRLSDANLKYRHQVNEVVPYLKNEIDKLKFQMKQKESDAKYKVEQLNQKVLNAQQQAIQVRSTLSFQIGYQVVHAFNPWYNIFSLPIKIWKIKKEFKKRKQSKTNTILNMLLTKKTDEYISSDTSTKEVISKKLSSNLSELRMACIMDEFTYTSYQPECILMQLTPENWGKELEEFNPEVLFIESAWRGKDDLWGNKVGHNAVELQNIVAYCKQNNIPTLFWNKEDPVHFETFLNTAQQFDYVFTTDMDCIHRYKGALGHDRVYLLPFATQPKMHNPIEKYDRKDAFCFAGAYYVRYPDRTKDLGNFVMHLSEKKPFEIYDRNFGKDDPNYMFPEEYKPFIVGTLAHSEIDKAYKGYNYAINLNSIKQSQTMFARRVFELLSSNTITISNFSRGIRLLFGDLVFTSDSSQELLSRLDEVTSDNLILKKHRLLALRKVLKEHTYAQRLSYIVSKIQNTQVESNLPSIGILSYAKNKELFFQILENFKKQTYKDKKLYVVIPNKLSYLTKEHENIVFILEKNDKNKILSDVLDEKWIAFFSEYDYYGENYILDFILATQYFSGKVIGKTSYFSAISNKVVLEKDGYQYKATKTLNAKSSIVKSELLVNEKIVSIVNSINNKIFTFDDMLSTDEFNYCLNGVKNKEFDVSIVDDIKNIDQGVELETLLNRAESIEPLKELEDEAPFLDTKILDNLFKTPKNKTVELLLDGTVLGVKSHLEDGKHEYIYAKEDLTLKKLGYKENMKFYLDTTLGLNIQLVVVFLDAQKQKISHVIKTANRNQESDIPLGTQYIRFGLRIYAGGYADIKALVLGDRPTAPAEILGKAKYLVLTNNYPSYEDLYKNAFVHSRVKAYKQNNVKVDIFKLRVGEELQYNEFENIDIMSGDQLTLDVLLKNGQYENVLVHFLSFEMWEVLQKHMDTIKVIVWVHGAEIHPWYRRKYNLVTKEDEINAKKQSEERMAFWHNVLDTMHKNLHLIFVSHSFAKEVFEDIGYKLSKEQYSVIHNPIDTQKFKYIKKDIEQRKKILSIRPFASRQYANDLSVKAILELSKKSFFDELEFHIIGNGKLFDETIEPIKEYKNVTIERKFIAQSEIAQLHKEYGLFLCPTRWDSQGVSRDESMASGLVPITNAVAAIPEFVDDSCGILAPADDALVMVAGIEKLYNNSELFLQMSENAAKRVRRQTSANFTIESELRIIQGNIQ